MASRHPDALVFALCHEVGNLLAALRLRADALGSGAADDGASAGAALSALAMRSGALLAQIRPLLAGPGGAHPLEPGEALARLDGDLAETSGGRAVVEAAVSGLPSLRCDPELLHQLLLGASLTALDEVGTVHPLRVAAGSRRERVVFVLSHEGAWRPGPTPARPSGLVLVRAVADELCGRLGGRATLGTGALELELPGAQAACG